MSTETTEEDPFIGPKFTPTSPLRSKKTQDTTATVLETRYDQSTENNTEEDTWINPHADKDRRQQQRLERKASETKILYQQTIEDTIKPNNTGSPTRNYRNSPNRPGRGSPNRHNRYAAPRPIQAEKNQGTNVVLSSLSSSRRDMGSRERES